VQEATVNPFSAWESFYVIVGSAGGALTGLQFVVIALLTDLRKQRTLDQVDAFATPTIVHFCAVLLIGSMLSAPWESLHSAAIALGVVGGAGIVYTAVIMRRVTSQSGYKLVFEDVTSQSGYKLVFEDWLFHTGLPFIAYAAVLTAGITLTRDTSDASFGVAGASLLLLFIGIHNAWDTVTFLVTEGENTGEVQQESAKKQSKKKGTPRT
jgi:hypothetical protein